MKTWRNILILFALVSFAACSKVENVYVPEAISYSVGSYAAATKAVPVTEFTSFQSKAWMHTVENPNGSLFFLETILYDGTSLWYPEHDYYWPKHPQNYLNFVSWYDAQGNPTTVEENSVVWNARTIQANDQILLADKAWRQKANSQTYYSTGVPTLFKHQLAQIAVKASQTATNKTVDGVTTEWAVSIKNFSIAGQYTKGTLSVTTSAPAANVNTSAWTGEWVADNTSAGSMAGPAAALSLADGTQKTLIDYSSVLPQPVSGITMSFDYDVATTVSKSGSTRTLTETVHVANLALSDFEGIVGGWEKNKRITYNISINPDTSVIVVVPTVVDWTTYSSTITIE